MSIIVDTSDELNLDSDKQSTVFTLQKFSQQINSVWVIVAGAYVFIDAILGRNSN